MDETSKEIAKETLEITIKGIDIPIWSLLLVYDVILAEIESTILQRMLVEADNTTNIYHAEYGALNSNVM